MAWVYIATPIEGASTVCGEADINLDKREQDDLRALREIPVNLRDSICAPLFGLLSMLQDALHWSRLQTSMVDSAPVMEVTLTSDGHR